MSIRNLGKNEINTTFNFKQQQSEVMPPYYTTKMETTIKKDINFKKLYLPSIQKKAIQKYPIPKTKLVKSHSQMSIHFPLEDKKISEHKNDEKEKLIIAKIDLLRMDSRINDIVINCKKLMGEKTENLKMIKEIINSNNSPEKENLYHKFRKILDDTLKKNNYNKNTFSTENFETLKYTIEEKNNKNREESGKIRINVSPINALNEKNNINNEQNQLELNNNINEEKREKNNENKRKEENKKNTINSKGMIEEIKNTDKNQNIVIDSKNKKIDELNQDISNLQDFSAENMLKINAVSANNSNFNNLSFNNVGQNMNNSLDDQINPRETIEEEKDEKDLSGIFGKSVVPKKVYNKVKIKSELSILKHKIINLQKQIRAKDEEIEEIKSKASMKNLIFQSNLLNTKMVKLHKIKTKNNKIEKLSIPIKNIKRGNLKNELDYYTKQNKSFICENKNAEESYIKARNEFEESNKTFTKLEIKNDNLKYKYNSLKLKDVKKQIDLDNMKKKINQIDSLKLMIENNIRIRDEKNKEIEETKNILENKKEECEKMKESRDKNYKEMSKLEKEVNNRINKQKNEVVKIQKDIKEIEKKILLEIDKYQHLTKNNKKFVNLNYIYKIKTITEFFDCLKEIEAEENKILDEKSTRFYNLKKGGKYSFYKLCQVKIKSKKKEDKINEVQQTSGENKEYYIDTNGNVQLKIDEKEDEKKEKNNNI